MIPALPLILVGLAGAAAGLVGAVLLDRSRAGAKAAQGDGSIASGSPPQRSPQTLVWCGRCATYYAPDRQGRGCDGVDCPHRV
jgi:hypothetical protein